MNARNAATNGILELNGRRSVRTASLKNGRLQMQRANVQLGKVYLAKVSGKLCRVRLERERVLSGLGGHRARHGWFATNLETGREIVIRTAAKLRREYIQTVPQSKDAVIA